MRKAPILSKPDIQDKHRRRKTSNHLSSHSQILPVGFPLNPLRSEKLLQPTGGLLSWSSQAPPTNKNITAVKNKMSQLPLTKLAKELNSPLKCKTKPTGK